jgi:hypothetical protein
MMSFVARIGPSFCSLTPVLYNTMGELGRVGEVMSRVAAG